MIKANELKLENWITTDDGYKWRVSLIENTEVRGYRILKNGDKYKSLPIPVAKLIGISITGKILQECGFSYSGIVEGKHLYWVDIKDKRFSIIKTDTELYLEITPSSSKIIFNSKKADSTPIQYVHQLQNIIFYLTGEELNIELTDD